MADHSEKPKHPPVWGHPLALDPLAASADPGLPAFLARPEGAPVYHGFPVLADVEVDGFQLGTITDFEGEEGATDGEAFVVAPDGSRAGLVWTMSAEVSVEEILPPESARWGVWSVGFPYLMRTRADAKRNLAAVLPLLIPHWERWRSRS